MDTLKTADVRARNEPREQSSESCLAFRNPPALAVMRDIIEKDMPYLAIMKNGHEYNVFIEDAREDGWLLGRVSVRMMVTLFDPGETSARLSVSLDNETPELKSKFESKDVYIQEPCSVKHKWQKVRMWASDVSLLEDSWRLPVRVVDGKIDEDYLVEKFPEFGKYRLPSGGFCTNPGAGGPIIMPQKPSIKLVKRQPPLA